MVYNLKIEIYGTKGVIIKPFSSFKAAFECYELTLEVIQKFKKLTRHSSCNSVIQHCGYLADNYNEVFLEIKKEN